MSQSVEAYPSSARHRTSVRGFHLTQPRISIGLKRSVIWLELHLRGVGRLAGDALEWFWGSRGELAYLLLSV